ncbi:MAG: GNAT family N-acetyltransferase [Deltaproteobacteria bacterium]|nr:GNAT family N-acetyltransferase [Deltaproteobacteria bacterium]
MSQQTYKIRNYRPSDFDEYVNLHIEAEKLDRSGLCTSRQGLREYLGRPAYNPEKDLFIAEASGRIVGLLNITPELIMRRVLLDCLVHPQHRRKGLAKRLLERVTQRAKELEVEVMQVNVLEENTVARDVISRLGFYIVRQFLEMSLSLSEAKLPDISNSEFTLRYLQRGEEERLAQIQNRSFADTWGFNPNTPEEIAYALNLSSAATTDVVLIYDAARPVGYCWTKINREKSAETGKEKGRIFMLGVDPDYRKRGIGRLALRAGLSYLKEKDIGIVELTVDSENPAACSLYKSFGFQVTARSFYYEKRVD